MNGEIYRFFLRETIPFLINQYWEIENKVILFLKFIFSLKIALHQGPKLDIFHFQKAEGTIKVDVHFKTIWKDFFFFLLIYALDKMYIVLTFLDERTKDKVGTDHVSPTPTVPQEYQSNLYSITEFAIFSQKWKGFVHLSLPYPEP